MMMFYENVRLALFSLKANKMRALLTMLGIIIGISSVIAIMTVGQSLTYTMTESMSSLGVNNITVALQQKPQEEETTEEGMSFGGGTGRAMAGEEDYFTREMLENYCDTYEGSVVGISVTEGLGQSKLQNRGLYANVYVTGTSLGYFLANDLELLAGRYFSGTEMDEGRKVAMVSSIVVDNMFGGDKEQALGSVLQVNLGDKYFEFVVVGVYKYEQSAMGLSLVSEKDTQTDFYIPLKTAQEISHSQGFAQFTVITADGLDSDAFADTTAGFFAPYYRNNRDFQPMAFSMASMVEIMSDMLSTITTAIAVIAGIALLVGGIGVMNIMLVSITERTREIGTRKALGAPNSAIRLQFIIESIVICLIGGLIGIVLGVVLGMSAANLLGASATPSLGSILLSLGFSMAIGIFFGYYPANKAARMDPIEALRYE
ncbi:MAG: ABC transporter permease [Acetatifactor sp.]|jgi:putative ABC transport system permease protein|nr:ABC transporter permease [Acetatifactor sp.]